MKQPKPKPRKKRQNLNLSGFTDADVNELDRYAATQGDEAISRSAAARKLLRKILLIEKAAAANA